MASQPVLPDTIIEESDAQLSQCQSYRYRLSRRWGTGRILAFVMLNPSTADATVNDRTINRCIGFAKNAGHSGIVVGNLFAWRATKPRELKKSPDPVGPDNDTALMKIFADASLVVCAWGAGGSLYGRDQHVLQMIKESGKAPHYLRLTSKGYPSHPLYLPADLTPLPLV